MCVKTLGYSHLGPANKIQELEALAETGAITDEQYDTIMNALPAESPLSGAARKVASPSPAHSPAPTAAPTSPPPAEPTAAFSNLNLNNDPAPPAYSSPTPPAAPPREAPQKLELTRATALYRYFEAGDCNFEVGDQIAVYEYMNADWWLGKNLRTGQEGVFPVNYVQVQAVPPPGPPPQGGYYGNDNKAGGFAGGYPQPQQYQSPPPPGPGPSNPYNSPVPPMAVAEQPVDGNKPPNKGAEMGKKFGKKLGNAAIFGAGATLGADLVNSIF